MFNLEILTDDTINNMCKYKSRLEKVMKLFSSKNIKKPPCLNYNVKYYGLISYLFMVLQR